MGLREKHELYVLTLMALQQTIQRRRTLERPRGLGLHEHRAGGGQVPEGGQRGARAKNAAVARGQGAG